MPQTTPFRNPNFEAVVSLLPKLVEVAATEVGARSASGTVLLDHQIDQRRSWHRLVAYQNSTLCQEMVAVGDWQAFGQFARLGKYYACTEYYKGWFPQVFKLDEAAPAVLIRWPKIVDAEDDASGDRDYPDVDDWHEK